MAQQGPTTDKTSQQNGDKVQSAEKIVISSAVTHASLIGAISERNPIIAGRAKP
jgi:hypothetical protein